MTSFDFQQQSELVAPANSAPATPSGIPYAPSYATPYATPYSTTPYPPFWYVPNPPQRTALGRTALVLGLLSFVAFGPLTGIPAIAFGIAGQRQAGRGRAANPKVARAGMILGICNTIWTAAIVLAFIYKFF